MPPTEQDCPRCWVPLEPVLLTGSTHDVEARRCPDCQGLFLRPGEVAKITGQERLGPLLVDYLDFEYQSLLVCPACGNQMEAKDVAGVEVDVCMACHAVWLDAGELTLLSRADTEAFVVTDDHEGLEIDEETRKRLKTVAKRLQKTLGDVRDSLTALAPGAR